MIGDGVAGPYVRHHGSPDAVRKAQRPRSVQPKPRLIRSLRIGPLEIRWSK